MEDCERNDSQAGIEEVKIYPDLLPEEIREFYSSPCSMNEFDEWKI